MPETSYQALKAKYDQLDAMFKAACKIADDLRAENAKLTGQVAKARAEKAPSLTDAIHATLAKAQGRSPNHLSGEAGTKLLKVMKDAQDKRLKKERGE